MEYYEYYLMGIILLPAIIFSLIAQIKVDSTFKRYGAVESKKGIPAYIVAQKALEDNGIRDVVIVKTSGHLTDYYSDKDKKIALSDDIYDSKSVAAIGIALHEVGHAMQYNENYKPVYFRNFMVKVCNISSKVLWPLVIIGLIFSLLSTGSGIFGSVCLWAGIGFFGFSVIFNLITLPVEYNASNRAKTVIKKNGLLDEEEQEMSAEVLNSAALTYVASLMVSIMYLVRF